MPSGVAGGAGAGAGPPWPLDVYVAATSNTFECQIKASERL